MALATIDSEGRADLSPKGDPAGALLKMRDGDVWYPDRPGNRRIDSFRNILTQPRIAAMGLIPGTTSVVHISGNARVTADEAMSASFAVNEKTPKVVTRIEQAQLRVSTSQALLRARLWPAVKSATDLDPAEIFRAHVKLSKGGGMTAAIARASVSVPGAMRKALDHDYKKNMY
jgi:predicted pyridoxine 5'-phosphate oxidase superfamily flavin-nucleotide-binding protein